jgi:hypothetical protein
VHVQVLNGQIVQFPETLVAQDGCLEGLEFFKMMLGMGPVVGLEDLGQEEDSMRFAGVEDCWTV